MTTLKDIALTCPVCDERFTSIAVRSVDWVVRKATDFRERAVRPRLIAYGVHVCPECGYAAGERDFTEHGVVHASVRKHVWTELRPRLSDGELTGSEKYEFAARVAQWDGADAMRVADLWLRAAWCCVDENDTEAERYYRRFAVEHFERALAMFDGVKPTSRAVITYLVGELWRRIGDERRAREWFARVADEVTRPREQQWIVDEARRQAERPREWF